MQVELPPYVPWFPTSPPPSGPATKIKGERGIPVPVGSELVDPDRTIESHGPSGDLSNPTGNGTGEGIGETHGGALEFPEEPPLPFTPVEVDAKVIRSVLPVYPEIARRSGLEGRVFVRIWVDKEGKCRKVEVLRSTADIFNDAAVEAAKQFLFTPAYMNSGPVSVWVAIPFLFTLKSN